MIGSREESANEVKKDFFIPLIDGSLIRFDQDEVNGLGYLEKTAFNMRDARFIEAISKDQCIVTGNSKTTAIQIDLMTGDILQVVGDDETILVKKPKDENNQNRDPYWMRLKKYEYLSYDQLEGVTQWRIFYSEFSHNNRPSSANTNLMPSNNPEQQLVDQQLFVRGNIIYSLAADEEAKLYQKWNMVSETPIFQVLNINKKQGTVTNIPVNQYTVKDKDKIKLVNFDRYTYADHSYLRLPDYESKALTIRGADWIPFINQELFQELTVPIKDNPHQNKDSSLMISDNSKNQINVYQEIPSYPNISENNGWKFLQPEILGMIALIIFAQYIIGRHVFKKEQVQIVQDNKQEEKLEDRIQEKSQIEEKQQLIPKKIEFDESKVLGFGSGGTVVYEGTLNGRIVAVKRMLSQHNHIAANEIQFLQKVDLHPNLITYYDKEEDKDFVCLAIEKCEGNLENLIEIIISIQKKSEEWNGIPLGKVYSSNPSQVTQPEFLRSLMRQALMGLQFLHQNGIVHRDVKPHNLLINKLQHLKLSDMGLSKQLTDDQVSYHTEIKGSLGWQPQEVILSEQQELPSTNKKQQKTQKVDIFSLGCVFYYLLSLGEHPFGKRYEREKNILNQKHNLNQLHADLTQERQREAANLIELMIKNDPNKRPNAEELLKHIFFWSNDKKLKLIQDLSDRLEFNSQANTDLIAKLELIGSKNGVLKSCKDNWPNALHNSLIQELQKWRKYNYSSFTDLLRFIRNKKNHYRELPEEAKKLVGSTNESYMKYFASCFPKMMLSVDEFVRKNLLEDPLFAQFYQIQLS